MSGCSPLKILQVATGELDAQAVAISRGRKRKRNLLHLVAQPTGSRLRLWLLYAAIIARAAQMGSGTEAFHKPSRLGRAFDLAIQAAPPLTTAGG